MSNNNFIKPKLEDIRKENPFEVPDNYLEDFPVKMANIICDKNNTLKEYSTWLIIKSKLVPAMVFSGITVLIIISVLFYKSQNNKEITASELIEVYNYTALNETSEAELIRELEKVSLNNNIKTENILNSSDNFTNEAIEYLKKENIDINTVIDAL